MVSEAIGIKGIYTGEISRKMHCFHHWRNAGAQPDWSDYLRHILEHLGYWYHDAKGAGYRNNFCIKPVELASLGFVLGKNILTTFEDGGGTIDTEKIDKMIQREFFTSPTVQEKTTGVNPEEFLKQQMQAQAAARMAG